MSHISGDVNFPAQCVISADASPPGMMENCLFPFGSSAARRTGGRALAQPQEGMRSRTMITDENLNTFLTLNTAVAVQMARGVLPWQQREKGKNTIGYISKSNIPAENKKF